MAGLVVLLAGSAAAATLPTAPPGATQVASNVWISAATYPPRPDRPTCRGANRAIGYYRAAYRTHRETMGITAMPARRWWGCNSARRRAAEWRDKAHAARQALQRWIAYNYDWRDWLPRNWYLVGSCETGYGGDPNWSHSNASFVSAFGITRANYARDAAWSGTPQWDDDDPPTPREQYQAALAHYEHHGDGWGCAGP